MDHFGGFQLLPLLGQQFSLLSKPLHLQVVLSVDGFHVLLVLLAEHLLVVFFLKLLL
jgi:hypothetical protein